MSKQWRPKGWEYQHARIINLDEHPEKTWDVAHDIGWRDGYEAGADAMLEGLKEIGLNKVTGTTPPCNGTVIFLPDEEKNE